MSPRCLLLQFWPDMDTNPVLMGLVRGLAARGVSIDLAMESRKHYLPPALPAGVRVHPVPAWREATPDLDRLLDEQGPFDLVLAVDQPGMVALAPLLDRLAAPLVFLCFEIFFEDEVRRWCGPEDLELLRLERQASRRAALVVVQDETRAGLLVTEHGLAPERLACLPVAPGDLLPGFADSDWLRRRFAIPADRRILLHTGSFDAWTAGEELLAAAEHLPPDWTLVIHSRQRPIPGSFLSQALDAAPSDRVVFSVEPLPFDQYPALVASCDAALVLYKTREHKCLGKNIRHIGLSSGKFSYACCLGKPVVSNDVGDYRRIFAAEGCGAIWEELSDSRGLGRVLEQITPQLPAMGHQSRKFFLDHLNLDCKLPPVLERIAALLPGVPRRIP